MNAAKPSDAEWRKKYENHLKSARWKNIRRDLFRMRGAKCEVCSMPSPSLEVHHLTYDRLGKELATDLKIVCQQCHKDEDRKREMAVASKREARRYSSAFDTWFFKKTGMDSFYANECDWDDFERWLDRTGDRY
jgi:5-methylcytosine-specific restriction endonuclease McrA